MSLAATANIVSASPLHVRQHNDGNDVPAHLQPEGTDDPWSDLVVYLPSWPVSTTAPPSLALSARRPSSSLGQVAQALHGLVTQGEMGVVFDESDEEV
uniref:Uncharacterized protein n=1 Tax=Oryza rufipogon TaxID=4529 RepID=A0A0E0NSN9_ORYRU